MTTRFEVDHAMMGQEWNGNRADLQAFCDTLQSIVGESVEIVPVFGIWNGATNRHLNLNSEEIVTTEQWNEALERTPAEAWSFDHY